MNDQLWSWILGAVGLAGFWLAGKKVWWCWYINIACQFLWLAYAIVTEQYGFIATAVVYFFVFSKNAREWTRDRKKMKHGVCKHEYVEVGGGEIFTWFDCKKCGHEYNVPHENVPTDKELNR